MKGAGLFVVLWMATQGEVCSAQTAEPQLPGMTEPLSERPGNPARGRRIVADVDNVTCLICHVLPMPEEPDMGAIGPSLVRVGNRFTEAQLRLRLVDPKAMNPNSIMPSYFKTDDLYRVAKPYRGKTIYTAQEIEDVVAYLASLTGQD